MSSIAAAGRFGQSMQDAFWLAAATEHLDDKTMLSGLSATALMGKGQPLKVSWQLQTRGPRQLANERHVAVQELVRPQHAHARYIMACRA